MIFGKNRAKMNSHLSNTLKPGFHVGSGPFFESELNRLTPLMESDSSMWTDESDMEKPPISVSFSADGKKVLY